MNKVRTFKAQVGKVLYCPTGDIVFTDGFYKTSDEKEIASILKGVGIEEVTGKEAEEATHGRKRSVVNPKQQAKDEEKEKKEKEEKAKEEAEEKKAEEEKAKAKAEAEAEQKNDGEEMIKVEVTQEMLDQYPEEFDGLNVGDFIEVSKEMSVEDAKAYLVQLGVDVPETDEEVISLAVEKASEELHSGDENEGEKVGSDEDIETMPKPRCVELLKKAGVAFKPNAGVADLRKLVSKLK